MALRQIGPCDVLGSTVTVHVPERLHEVLRPALADLRPASRAHTATRISARRSIFGVWTVQSPGRERYVGTDVSMAMYDVLCALNDVASLSAAEAGHVPLHGGAVAVGGRAAVFVGHSGAGKSTLTAAMVLAGHPLIADEISALTPDNEVLPYHRPIGLRRAGVDALGLTVPAGPYGAVYPLVGSSVGALVGPAPAACVIFVERALESTAGWSPLGQGEALARLANQTLGTKDRESWAFRRLERLVREIPVIEVRYQEAVDAVPTVIDAVGALA